MTAYYNEYDKHAAAWLRALIAEGLIAPGVVDERSIEDVTPGDLAGFAQCHFFAGIGGWSLALRLAGVPDSARVWTGSCPCQPFSEAGKGAGFADERHLWPHFHHLIRIKRPPKVFGEQSASRNTDPWIDLVHADLEGVGYAFGCVAFPSAGIGAPHLRDRTYWVADSDLPGTARYGRDGGPGAASAGLRRGFADRGILDRMGDADRAGLSLREREALVGAGWREEGRAAEQPGRASGGLADAALGGRAEGRAPGSGHLAQGYGPADDRQLDGDGRPGPVNGFWADADWLFCRDEKWRAVEPGASPLADGVPGRVGALRGYGNAVNVYAAKAFIEAFYQIERSLNGDRS
jgi:DNA (cytosine-5)-methyltransferase 1